MRGNKKEKWYAVITLGGDAIVRTWEEAQKITKTVGGAELHHKFYSKEEAEEWIRENKHRVRFWEERVKQGAETSQ